MTGYREHSFDPNAFEQAGAPLRPFNRVQWVGLGVAMVGLAIDLLYLAGRLGWVPARAVSPTLAMPAIVVGVVLINSRRQPGTLVGSEQLARNRRLLLITAIICAVILGVVAIIELKGV